MTATNGMQVVRVRVRTHGWASPGMPMADAERLLADVSQRIENVGGSYGLVEFTGRDKQLRIRAREVIAVEIVPEAVDRPGDHRPASGPGFAPAAASGFTIAGHDGPAPDGTSFLREQAARRVQQRPAGAHRSQS